MTAVVNYWGKKPDTATEAYGYRNYVENIQILYPSIAPLLSDTRASVRALAGDSTESYA